MSKFVQGAHIHHRTGPLQLLLLYSTCVPQEAVVAFAETKS